jgi:hypothetical protein
MTKQATASVDRALTVLAGRIKAEHAAVCDSLKASVRHAMAAGDLLIEAKAALPHGQWLPWLRDHCGFHLRTAQSYMRLANDRAAIEAANRDSYLPIREAVALLAAPAEDVEPSNKQAEMRRDATPHEIPARVVAFFLIAKRLRSLDPRIELSPTGLYLPPDLTREKWRAVGQLLARECPDHVA